MVEWVADGRGAVADSPEMIRILVAPFRTRASLLATYYVHLAACLAAAAVAVARLQLLAVRTHLELMIQDGIKLVIMS